MLHIYIYIHTYMYVFMLTERFFPVPTVAPLPNLALEDVSPAAARRSRQGGDPMRIPR